MKTAALIFGLLAGLLGGLVLAFGTIEANLAAVPAFGAQGTLLARLLVYVVPAIGWIGTGIVLARPRFGALCLLLSAAGWVVLALAAGHGGVLFAAPPFTFAAAAGVVALFARRNADRDEVRGTSQPAVPTAAALPKLSREENPPETPRAPRPALQQPIVAPDEPDTSFRGPAMPPPFRDDIPEDGPPADNAPSEDPGAAVAAALATLRPEEEERRSAASAEPVAASGTGTASAALAPPTRAVAAEPGAAGLRARRPGEWSLPSPADAAAPRYAAERQVPPAGLVVSAPVLPQGQPGAPTAKTASMAQPTTPPLVTGPSPARISAPNEVAPTAAAALDFAPSDDYGRGDSSRIEAAGRDSDRRKPGASRRVIEENTEAETEEEDAAAAERPRAARLRSFLRGAIAAVFLIAVVGICGSIYLDYLRGPKSILFGQRVHETEQSQAAPASAPVTTTPAAVRPPAPATAPPAKAAAATPVSAPTPLATAAVAPSPTPSASSSAADAAAVAAAAPATTASATTISFTDPVRYCAAVRTIDAPDSHYAGPPIPPAVATALTLPTSATASQIHWRCADGVALACNDNNTASCSLTPTVQYMLQYCAAHPDATEMPAPNGSWSCNGKRPVIPDNQSWPVDANGFYPDAWVRVSPLGAR